MDNILKRPFVAVSILVVLCGYLFFARSGGMALTDPDETFYAQTAKEMLAKNEWNTPYLYGKPQFEKPIMMYWLVEASYRAFGVNEASARLPSAVFALIGVVAMYLLGSLLFNARTGFLSAVILATNVEYIILSRACVTDMTLTAFMLLGVLFFFYGFVKRKGYYYILSSAALALAVLTKGPMALFLPVVILSAFLMFTKNLGRLKEIPFAPCFLVFTLIAGPWYFQMYKLHGKDFIDAFFGFHNVTRFMQSEHKIGSQVYYNIPVVMGGFFPWSAFLPFGLWRFFVKAFSKASAEKENAVFVLAWFFGIFLFFTASSTKLPTYIFPCFISLALIVGVLWDDFLKASKDARRLLAGVKVSFYLLIISVTGGAAGIAIYINGHLPEAMRGAIVAGAVLVAGFIAALLAFMKRRYAAAFFLIVCALAAFLWPVGAFVAGDIERYETSKEIASRLLPLMKPGERLGSQSNYIPGLAFYADKFAENIDDNEAMLKLFNSDERIWCVIKDKNHRSLYDPSVNSVYVKPSYLIYGVGKRSIVTNKLPDNGAYLLKRERAG